MPPERITQSTLFYGGNLRIGREYRATCSMSTGPMSEVIREGG